MGKFSFHISGEFITDLERKKYMTFQDLQTINVGYEKILSKATIETMDLLAFGKILTNYLLNNFKI